jgi:putative nucleotidyltransferase with HDIG domain
VTWIKQHPEDNRINLLEESFMPHAASPQAETEYRWEYYRSAYKCGDSEMLHELGRSLCGQNEYPSDFFAWFSAFENQLAEINTSRKETGIYENSFIKTVSLLAESQDPYTARHQKKVSELAADIAREMGLCDDMIQGIRVAGMVHDMGKMSVPAEIVTKPGVLTSSEFSIMKEHPQRAYAVLKRIEFPWPIAEIVLQHHERLDGSGYPQGLKGKDIRLEACILAVADVVEAISSHRPYRANLGIEAALKEIDENRGRLYDTEVTRACQRSLKSDEPMKQFLAFAPVLD